MVIDSFMVIEITFVVNDPCIMIDTFMITDFFMVIDPLKAILTFKVFKFKAIGTSLMVITIMEIHTSMTIDMLYNTYFH